MSTVSKIFRWTMFCFIIGILFALGGVPIVSAIWTCTGVLSSVASLIMVEITTVIEKGQE